MAVNNSINYRTTNHNVLLGSATNTLTNLPPSATLGIAVVSAGAAADPIFGTVAVAGGGTGATTLTGVLTGNGTSAITASTVTQYGVVVAGASNAVTSIAPSATSGVPVISQGSSANPVFGTAVVAGGGTGAVTLTGVLTGNGTSAVTANAVTNHGVVIGAASNAVGSTAVGATGTVLIGTTGSDPSFSAAPVVTSVTFGSGTALSSYVESTFTPTVVGSGTPGTATYTAQTGVYTRIGRMVFYNINLGWNSGTGAGNLQVGGLPFNPSATPYQTFNVVYTGATATATEYYFFPTAGTDVGDLNYSIAATGGLGAVAYAAVGTVLQINGMYLV